MPAHPPPTVDTASAAPDLTLRPSGALVLAPGAGAAFDAALERGEGHAVLCATLDAADAPLPPGLAYLRAVGRHVLERLRRSPGLDGSDAVPDVPASDGEIDQLTSAFPPIRGAEYASADRVERLWRSTVAAIGEDVGAAGETVGAWLERRAPHVHAVGRICVHLAEDPRDAERPFAFVATYTTGLAGDGSAARHRPLGRALQDYAAASDRDALLALLRPLRRAAEESPLVRDLLESKEIFRAQRWTPDRALALLHEIPRLESAGVVVRVPDWWRGRRKSRASVQVTIGSAPAAGLGAGALLDFDVACAVDGEALTSEEWDAVRASAGGLVRLRGRWVEIDPARLDDLLDHWRGVAEEGISFVDGLRLLARTDDAAADADPLVDDDVDWLETSAGPWLRERLERLRRPEIARTKVPGLRATLRPYQRKGLTWLRQLTELGLGGCLADDMGLGKTVQVLALLASLERRPGRGPHLLVVPASLIANWAAESARFTPGLRLLIAHSSFLPRAELRKLDEGALCDVDVVVTSYGTARTLPWIADVPWDVAVLDEAQAIKNPSARQTRAIKKLDAASRFALTGTPVENRLGDLWSIFDFVCPGLLGSARAFGKFVKHLGDSRSEERMAGLRELIRPYVLRRLKTDPGVAPDLPDKTEMRALCTLTPRQAALYEKAVTDLAAKLAQRDSGDGIERRGLVLAAILGLKQICNHPDQWLGTGDFDAAGSGKLVRLDELAREVASRQEKMLVFTQFREMTAPLEARLAEAFDARGLVLHGGTPVRERGRLVGEFQSEDGPPFFVLSLKAGGTGLNLTAAQHVVHFDRWWNPAVEDQATDRAYRIGQTRSVLVHKLVCRGTIEEKIDELIESKRELAESVVGGASGASTLTELSDDELLHTLRLDLTTLGTGARR